MVFTNLLTNMIVVALNGDIPTNTPAFQAHSLQLMLTNAQAIASALHWDRSVIGRSNVTEFWAKPSVTGIRGGVSFSNRYRFGYRNGRLALCMDDFYDDVFMSSGDYKQMSKVVNNWQKARDLLSMESARKLAELRFRSIGLTPEETNLGAPLGRQLTFTDRDGETIWLPYYIFEWKALLAPALSNMIKFPVETVYQTARIDVSGVNARVVKIECQTGSILVSGRKVDVDFGESFSPCLKMIRPTNYLEMLGFPPDTIFVRRKIIGEHWTDHPPIYESFPERDEKTPP